MERIGEKIAEIEEYLEELAGVTPSTFEEYKTDLKSRAACERYLEKIIAAVIDLAFLAAKGRGIKVSEEDNVFDLLYEDKAITAETLNAMKSAKGMRNIIAHQYGIVDDEIVYESATSEIDRDTRVFLEEVKKALLK